MRGRRRVQVSVASFVVAGLALTVGGCGDSSANKPADSASEPAATVAEPAETQLADPDVSPATDPAAPASEPGASPVTELRDGPISVVALGDSLTAGEGDDSGVGYVGRLTELIGATPGREDPSLSNYGASGWDSTMMVDGQEGSPAELGAAVEDVKAAVADGRAALAIVLIGSNDMWYLYEYGPEGPTTPTANEDAAAETYRTNLDRTVRELSEAGAVVVLGLPDDQSIRPAVADIDRLHAYLPAVTVEEVQQMSAMAGRLGQVTTEVAAEYGLRTVDTNGPFWADASKMNDDGIHPNGDGYADLAALWFTVIQELL